MRYLFRRSVWARGVVPTAPSDLTVTIDDEV